MVTVHLLVLVETARAAVNYHAEAAAKNAAEWSRVVPVTESRQPGAFVAGGGASEHNGHPGKGARATPPPQRGRA